jgi:uncharacterized phage protein (TIGR01671 family)
MKREIKFRTFQNNKMIYQGSPDLETLESFIFHWGCCDLMQFTGLTDRNGKEIYEGDIVRPFHDDKGLYAKIVYFDSVMAFKIATPDKTTKKTITWKYFKEEIEVVGNIYENPELLD